MAGASLDATPTAYGEQLSLRMTFLHVTTEWARHNGHADLLREHIDGFAGT
ncbi:mycothiol transferase [Kitasatospora griseola]|uniref:mycothiol transferase n=1 Tax=Kitasatospora griseola TaxID=2064 RepID=UPI0037F26E0B